ncbi:hypothetical protein [Iodobacter sp.]|uniref:hypothetical protein n=1 Tax=Iodobacter sp. TaxID=1915058 RepID=UPI0025E51278|nr:hypothetical protein [Iodobacter sp.]
MSVSIQLIDTIYAKTAKGQQEIAERSFGLSARMRRLLILIDGAKSSSTLTALLIGLDIHPSLTELAQAGFIQDIRIIERNIETAIAEKSLEQSIVPQALSPSVIDPLLLEQAKNLMAESAKQFLGLMANSLITEIQACNIDNYKQTIARWNMALRQSHKAKQQADQYVDAVKTLIGLE